MRIDSVWLHWPQTRKLAEILQPIRFVGGCVRDALLGREVRDVDVATPLTPQQVMEQLKAHNIKVIPTGIDHGTVTAIIGERHFEITTLRRDVATDGRHATVAFTDDWEEDAKRRDFTMNALSCDADGRIHDYTDGVRDATAGHVRFIGDAARRIEEDALRILRFFRFYAHYGKGPADTDALKACEAASQMVGDLSGERVQQEMLKLLLSPRAGEVVELMQATKVTAPIWKTESLKRLPDALAKTGMERDAILALALLIRSLGAGPGPVDLLAERWKLSNAITKRLIALCDTHYDWRAADEAGIKKQIRAAGKERFTERAVITLAEGAAESAVLASLEIAKTWDIPIFPVTGNDLLARGIPAGKKMGETLRLLESQWEAEDYTPTRDQLLSRL